jgi:hypothetical protein
MQYTLCPCGHHQEAAYTENGGWEGSIDRNVANIYVLNNRRIFHGILLSCSKMAPSSSKKTLHDSAETASHVIMTHGTPSCLYFLSVYGASLTGPCLVFFSLCCCSVSSFIRRPRWIVEGDHCLGKLGISYHYLEVFILVCPATSRSAVPKQVWQYGIQKACWKYR